VIGFQARRTVAAALLALGAVIERGGPMKFALLVAVAAPILFAGSAHAGTIIAIPEPTSLVLLSVGAAAVAVGAWWRNR